MIRQIFYRIPDAALAFSFRAKKLAIFKPSTHSQTLCKRQLVYGRLLEFNQNVSLNETETELQSWIAL